MEHLSTATVNAIVKQIKDLQKNPAEGITVRSFSFFGSREMRAREKERERERDERRQLLLEIVASSSSSSSPLFFFFCFLERDARFLLTQIYDT
jgi:hypothetical protein